MWLRGFGFISNNSLIELTTKYLLPFFFKHVLRGLIMSSSRDKVSHIKRDCVTVSNTRIMGKARNVRLHLLYLFIIFIIFILIILFYYYWEKANNLKVSQSIIWDKVLKSRLSKFYGRQSLKNFKGYGVLKQTISL